MTREFMRMDENEFRLRLLQALEGIQDELRRIKVAEGPCDNYREMQGFDPSILGGRVVGLNCALASGHTGKHCTHGLFADPNYSRDYHTWDD